MAQSGHFHRAERCPLLGVKRTSAGRPLECAPRAGQFHAAVLTDALRTRQTLRRLTQFDPGVGQEA
jgi:hypothetical protein